MKTLTQFLLPVCLCISLSFNDSPASYNGNPVHEATIRQQSAVLQKYSAATNKVQFSRDKYDEPVIKGQAPYVTNNSHETIYYKPESIKANPNHDQNGAYPILPGEALYYPVDGLITPHTKPGQIYRVPTGSRIIISEDGIPEPDNLIAKAGILLDSRDYGFVTPPDDCFAKLANAKIILERPADISKN